MISLALYVWLTYKDKEADVLVLSAAAEIMSVAAVLVAWLSH